MQEGTGRVVWMCWGTVKVATVVVRVEYDVSPAKVKQYETALKSLIRVGQ
jgi:hypothetical protein